MNFQGAGNHVHDARLKQALGFVAGQVQSWHGAESALQAHNGQIPGALMHLAGERPPPALAVEHQDRGLDGVGDLEGHGCTVEIYSTSWLPGVTPESGEWAK